MKKNKLFIIMTVLGMAALFGAAAYWSKDEIKSEVATPKIPVSLIRDHSFSSGPVNAKVTVVEFFDPECESCAAVAPYIKGEIKYYNGKVRWVFRYMPYHHNSKTAIKVLEAARRQNKFLEVLEVLFENQKVWGEKQVSTEALILGYVSHVPSVDVKKLKQDMIDPKLDELINMDEADGKQAGVSGTPTFFVNGVPLERLDLDMLIKRIDEQLGTP